MASHVRIVLNGAGVQRLLATDPAIQQLLADASDGILAELPTAAQDTAQQTGRQAGAKPYSREGDVTDRQRREVGLAEYTHGDFLQGTIQKAIERAGGRKK